MHKSYYASGFLFHPASEQILLHQDPTSDTPEWSLFSGANKAKETPEQTFYRIIRDELGIEVDITACHVVYDYQHREKKVPHYIFYAVVDEAYDEEVLLTEHKTAWFYFRQIIKLPMKKQTRQDITVGQRVINLALRELLPTT